LAAGFILIMSEDLPRALLFSAELGVAPESISGGAGGAGGGGAGGAGVSACLACTICGWGKHIWEGAFVGIPEVLVLLLEPLLEDVHDIAAASGHPDFAVSHRGLRAAVGIDRVKVSYEFSGDMWEFQGVTPDLSSGGCIGWW
jgi:hypothetical protein